jgi:5-methylcytosine-specific restriction protein A
MLAERMRAGMAEVLAALDAACAPSTSDAERVEVLREYGAACDQLGAHGVQLIAVMGRSGVFVEHGYTKPEYAIADLLGWDRSPARRRVRVAEQVCPRVGLDGQILPAVFPATGAVLAEGRITVAHAEAIVDVLHGPAARRLQPETWAGAEEQIAHYAATTRSTPGDVAAWARQLLDLLDQDGPEPADEPDQVNELHRTPNRSGTGGRIRGELNGPVWEALDTLLATLTKPCPDDDRSLVQREADALGEICEHALGHNTDLPDTGGERPQIRVTVGLDQLRNGVTGAHLDSGTWYSPTLLRMLACDCSVIPAILGTHSEPLDIGRATRTIPTAIRRAVAIRDHGCAYPGCHRPPSYCDVHHCKAWENGGDTALHNCVMLCRHHHRIVHSAGWVVRIRQGQPEFIPPQFIDRYQQIRRRPQAVAY